MVKNKYTLMGMRFSTRFMLVVLCVLCFMWGVRRTLAWGVHPVDFVLIWVIAIMMIYLCMRDARRNGWTILPIYRTIMFFTWPTSILFYYIRFHGCKGLMLVLVWGLLFGAAYFAGGFLAILFTEMTWAG